MFQGQLYTQQKPAAEFLLNKKKAFLAWEQGSGKTIISLAATEKLYGLGKAQHTLILAPGALAWQWEDKIKEFTSSRVVLSQASKEATRTYRPERPLSYWITPYSLLRRDWDSIIDFPWDIVIADEAQEFKNYRSKTYKLMLALNRAIDPTYRWALTGTAISTKLEELYSVFYWVDKTFLPPWPQFEKNHIVRNKVTNRISSYKNLKALHDYLPARLDRKRMVDLGRDIPKLVEQVHKIDQTNEYKKAETKLLDLLNDMAGDLLIREDGELQGHIPPAVSRAFHSTRQALYGENKLAYCKRLVKQILDENATNRIVIFSYLKQPLYRLGDYYGSEATSFTGDESANQKRDNIKQFSESTRILLASNAGSTGLDLPFANYVINLDVPFSFGVLDQRIKRIRRLSSTFNTAVAISLIMEDSLEAFYYSQVRLLQKLAETVLDEGKYDEIKTRPISLRQYITQRR